MKEEEEQGRKQQTVVFSFFFQGAFCPRRINSCQLMQSVEVSQRNTFDELIVIKHGKKSRSVKNKKSVQKNERVPKRYDEEE